MALPWAGEKVVYTSFCPCGWSLEDPDEHFLGALQSFHRISHMQMEQFNIRPLGPMRKIKCVRVDLERDRFARVKDFVQLHPWLVRIVCVMLPFLLVLPVTPFEVYVPMLIGATPGVITYFATAWWFKGRGYAREAWYKKR